MKNVTKFAAVLLLIVMAVLIALSGTYAKYTSAIAGEDSATVATWNIVVDGERLGTEEASFASFDLFTTVKDSNGTDTETDVKADTIAPGTQGSFKSTVQNKSEVTAKYSIEYTVSNDSGIPLEFSVDGGNTWTTGLTNVDPTTLAMGSDPVDVTVMWRWAFEGTSSENYKTTQTDVTDTDLGTATTIPNVTVGVKLLVEQAD